MKRPVNPRPCFYYYTRRIAPVDVYALGTVITCLALALLCALGMALIH